MIKIEELKQFGEWLYTEPQYTNLSTAKMSIEDAVEKYFNHHLQEEKKQVAI